MAVGQIKATNVSNTATTNISSTTVQASLKELDDEKVAIAGDTMTGTLIINPSTDIALRIKAGKRLVMDGG